MDYNMYKSRKLPVNVLLSKQDISPVKKIM